MNQYRQNLDQESSSNAERDKKQTCNSQTRQCYTDQQPGQPDEIKDRSQNYVNEFYNEEGICLLT